MERLMKDQRLVSSEALNLIERLLCLDPKQRLSAAAALEADFFRTYDHEKSLRDLRTVSSVDNSIPQISASVVSY